MKLKVEGHNVVLQNPTALEWLNLDLEGADPKNDYLKYLSRKVSFAIVQWDDQEGLSYIEIEHDRSLHNIASALSNYLDKHIETVPELKAESRGEEVFVYDDAGGEFSALLKLATIAELYALIAKYEDDGPVAQKVNVLAELIVDWNGQGRVTAEDLTSDRVQHKFILAVDQAIEPFFRAPEITEISPGVDDDLNSDEQREDEPEHSELVEPVAVLVS